MGMKLKVQKLMDVTLLLTQIIRERRPMPQKGKMELARMHAKLEPEFKIIDEQRNEIIKAYDTRIMVPDPGGRIDEATGKVAMVEGDGYQVPEDKLDEFNKKWEEIAEHEVEVDIKPIPLKYIDLGLGSDGSIEAFELIMLGDLITE